MYGVACTSYIFFRAHPTTTKQGCRRGWPPNLARTATETNKQLIFIYLFSFILVGGGITMWKSNHYIWIYNRDNSCSSFVHTNKLGDDPVKVSTNYSTHSRTVTFCDFFFNFRKNTRTL